MTEGYAVRHCYHFLLRQSEVLDPLRACRLGYGDHARGSARKARDDHAGVVAEPRPKVPGCVQHTEVVNRDDGRKAPADWSQPGGEVEQVGTRAARRALHAPLMPPDVATQGAGHGTDRSRARGWRRSREPAADGNEAVAQDGRSEERRVGKESRSRWSPYH